MKGVLPLLLLVGLGGCASSSTTARVAEADPWAGFNNGYTKEPEKPAEAPAPPPAKASTPAPTAAPKQVSAPAATSAPKQVSAPAAAPTPVPNPSAEPSGASQAADLLENARPTRAPVASTAEPPPTKAAKKHKHPGSKGARGKARRHPKPGT